MRDKKVLTCQRDQRAKGEDVLKEGFSRITKFSRFPRGAGCTVLGSSLTVTIPDQSGDLGSRDASEILPE